jgi:sulfatase maturation enzyme AslB (radical SAM superfamily)
MAKTDTYCALPFVHFAVKPDGVAKPCCRFVHWDKPDSAEFWAANNHNKIGTDAVLNGEQFASVREAMLNGERVHGCWKCYQEEERVGYSMRTMANDRWGDTDDTVTFKYLEVSFGNYCNLSCRTCNSNLSTTWYEDDLALSRVYKENRASRKIMDIDFTWKPEDFANIEEIKFVGGEPMLNPNFAKFLETVLAGGNAHNTKLTIFTNTSWFPKQKIIDLLTQFGEVLMCLSIDSVGKYNDYIRNGSDWTTLSGCALRWLDLESDTANVGACIAPTINILNIDNIHLLFEWWYEQRKQRQLGFKLGHPEQMMPGDFVTSMVYYPQAYSVDNYPNKSQLADEYRELRKLYTEDSEYVDKFYNRIINILTKNVNESKDLRSFIEYNKDLDKLRSQSFAQVYPRFYQMIQEQYDSVQGRLDET